VATEPAPFVEGQLDIEDSETAREVWRSVKRGRVSLSFGFLVKAAHDEGDVRVLDEIDLFEVSIVSAPANEDTRILRTKAMDDESDRLRGQISRHMYELMTAPLDDGKTETTATKRHAPITVKSYRID
jgi:phage head maturation protease